MKEAVMASVEITPDIVTAVVAKHRGKPGELLGALEELQNLHPHKYLPPEVMEWTAERAGVPVSQVYSVATFYAFFNLKPQGEHTVVVCRGTACHTRGSKSLLESLKRLLNVQEEEGAEKIFLTTPDKKFTLKTVACFGQCALAPVVELDGKMYSNVTDGKLKELVAAAAKAKK